MDLNPENFLLIGSILLFVSVIAGRTSYRFGVPTLLLFILVGILAGCEGILKIEFDSPAIAQYIGILALNFILFSGGLSTDIEQIKPVFKKGLSLATIGVLVTAVLTGLFVHWLTDFTVLEGLLLGSIVASTDSAAVFSVLRAKKLGLKDNIKPLLEFESGSNDPMAYILVLTFLSLITSKDSGIANAIVMVILQLVIGGAVGIVMGRMSRFIINRIRLEYEGLYFVLTIAIMYFTFSFANTAHGNGFLAVYLCGLILGNSKFVRKNTILQTFDGFAWLMQIIMFLTLGLLVVPSELTQMHVWVWGLIISLFMVFFARPVAVVASTALCKKMGLRSRLFVSWVGLKGAVPIVFATYPFMAKLDNSQMIFNIVFFISSISLLIQGSSISFIAKKLRIDTAHSDTDTDALNKFIHEDEKSVVREIKVKKYSHIIGKSLIDLQLPKKALIALISRHSKYIIPDGTTTILEGDILMVLAEDKENMDIAEKILGVGKK